MDKSNLEIGQYINIELDEKSEKLDIEWLEKHGKKIPMTKINKYRYIQEKRGERIEIDGNKKNGYRLEYTPGHAYFSVVKRYYPNGIIEEKGLAFYAPGYFKERVWYEYDESGYLSGKTNFNNAYEYSFEKIVTYCKDNNIPLLNSSMKDKTKHGPAEINKVEIDNKKAWMIKYYLSFDKIERIWLDSRNGKILKKENETFFSF